MNIAKTNKPGFINNHKSPSSSAKRCTTEFGIADHECEKTDELFAARKIMKNKKSIEKENLVPEQLEFELDYGPSSLNERPLVLVA